MRHLQHENVCAVKHVLLPPKRHYKDVFVVLELMDTDLHKVRAHARICI